MCNSTIVVLTALLLAQQAIQSASFLTKNPSFTCCESGIHRQRHHILNLLSDDFERQFEVSRTCSYDGDDSTATTSSHPIKYHIHNPMNLSSQKAAPILVLHGGPGVPSDYLLPLRDVVPYRSMVFYDQLGCGRSPGPESKDAYSIESSLDDLELVIKKSGLNKFHLYGQSYGGILAFEYMKRVAERQSEDDNYGPKCLSAILSSTPCDVEQVESAAGDLIAKLMEEDPQESTAMDRFQARHACRATTTDGEKPQALADAYERAGTPGVWRGTDSIKGWKAATPSESSKRMPSCMVMRGEHDFVTADCVEGWKTAFNHKFVRVKELANLSHHGLLEDGTTYGAIVDSYFAEYD